MLGTLKRARAQDVFRPNDFPVPAACRSIERRTIGVARERDDAIIRCSEHGGQKDDLRVEPLIDLALDKAMQDKGDHDSGGDKCQRDETRGPDQEPSAERACLSFMALPQVRRYPRPRTVSIIS